MVTEIDSEGWVQQRLLAIAVGLCRATRDLVVVGTSLVAGPGRLLVFLAYGIGMAIVLMAVTVSAVLFQGTLTRYRPGVVPYAQQIGALLLVVAGAYMVVSELPLVLQTQRS